MQTPGPSSPRFLASASYFLVKDLARSLDYYHRVLGFSNPRLWEDPPTFAMPARDGFTLMLQQAAAGQTITTNTRQGGLWDAYFWVNNADALFTSFKAAGAAIEYEPRIEAGYAMKEFALRDPDGYILAFGQDISRD